MHYKNVVKQYMSQNQVVIYIHIDFKQKLKKIHMSYYLEMKHLIHLTQTQHLVYVVQEYLIIIQDVKLEI